MTNDKELPGINNKLKMYMYQCSNIHQFVQKVRQIPPGGQKIVNVTDEKVISVAEAGVDLLNERRGYSDTMLRVSLGEITSGTSEAVAGEMFRLELNVGVSHCLNTFGNIGKTEKDCPILSDSGVYNCWLEVLYRYWDNIQYRLINHTCTPPVEDNYNQEIHVCHVYVTLDSTNQYLKALRDSNCRVEGTTGKPDLVG